MSDLTNRLRSPATAFYDAAADGGALLREAADRIDALEAELATLRADPRLALRKHDLALATAAAAMASIIGAETSMFGTTPWTLSAHRLQAATEAFPSKPEPDGGAA